ncbi:MAG: DEAD/DEAH box helicase family protein [bacterium]|nr:DEAD/DEAH box helicase family protein [bacterium]
MENTANWLSIENAAKYLGMGKTVLYTLAREGRIPANKVGKKWVFEKGQLDTWLRANSPMDSFFTNLDYNITDNDALREPQLEAYLRTYDFFRSGKNKAILQIPVGCGKSGLSSILPLGIAKGRVLIIAPNLTIRKTLYDAMDITNRQKCFWRKAQVLGNAQMVSGPLACTLETGNISVTEKAHIVITNIHQLATNVDKWLTQFPDNFFDMIIIDEAHHSAADSWKKVLDRFPEAKVVHLTATPFRSDKQTIDGELVYRYPFRSATLRGYIKRLKASYIAPKEIELLFTDGSGKKYSLEQVLKLKEEDWFSKNVALAKTCNLHIAESSLEKLEELRLTGTRHQIIAVACSINHAKDIRTIYRERGYSADIIHSNQTVEEQDTVLRNLYNGTLDCIIQVQMLGEGFDHPKLSVAAIFRPFRSLAPYIQFVGRIMRVVVQNDPAHPDNLGHIVTHLGMNLDQRLKEFKQFENDDQAFWEKVVGGADPEVPSNVRAGSARLTASENDVIINSEIVDSLWEEDFADMDEKYIVDDLKDRLKLYGLDPDKAEEMIKGAKRDSMTRRAPTEAFPIQPQKEWEESKSRLNDQGTRLAKILLNNVSLEFAGTELAYKYTSLKARSKNNLVSAIMLVNHEINIRLGNKDRSKCSTEEFKSILENKTLEEILRTLVRRVHKAKNEYEKSNPKR